MVYEIVADLGGNHDVIESAREGFCDEVFASTVAVGVGGIEKGDAFITRRVHEAHGLIVRVVTPPSSRERPETKTYLADLEVRAAKLTIFHTVWNVVNRWRNGESFVCGRATARESAFRRQLGG